MLQFNFILSQMSFHHRTSLGNYNCFIGLCFVLWFVLVGEAVPLSIGHRDSTLQIYPKAMFNTKFNHNSKVSIISVIHLIFFIDKSLRIVILNLESLNLIRLRFNLDIFIWYFCMKFVLIVILIHSRITLMNHDLHLINWKFIQPETIDEQFEMNKKNQFRTEQKSFTH